MDYCPSCDKEVSATVELGGAEAAFKPIRTCSACSARTLPHRPGEAPAAKVLPMPNRSQARQVAPASARTADQLVEEARAQLAALDVEIPEIEANLARARAHRRGLAKMIDAYDRGAAAKG